MTYPNEHKILNGKNTLCTTLCSSSSKATSLPCTIHHNNSSSRLTPPLPPKGTRMAVVATGAGTEGVGTTGEAVPAAGGRGAFTAHPRNRFGT